MAPAPSGEGRAALASGVAAYALWGFLPLYFHLLGTFGVRTPEMIAHRTLWAVFWAFGLVVLARQTGQLRAIVRQPRTMGLLALSTLAILVNWTIYVIAVNAGHVLEASLGYYINPLMNMAVGALLFRERMARAGQVAIALATIGVAIQTVAMGHLPVISLALAISFCVYGVIRKQVRAEAQTGLFIECAYLTLPGLAYVVWLEMQGQGHALTSPGVGLLLLAAGPATVAPLALFAWSARRLPLTALGFLQFLAPTLQFGVGIALGEPLTGMGVVAFGFIWAGVAVFAFGAWRSSRRAHPSAA